MRRFTTGLAVTAVMLASAGSAHAATITPNTFTDEFDGVPDATCSLREAVQSSSTNANVGGCSGAGAYGPSDIVTLPGGTYRLTIPSTNESNNANGDLDVNGQITIRRATTAPVTLDGAQNDRVLEFGPASIGSLLEGVTLTGGKSAGGFIGGAVFVNSTLTIKDSTISGNTSPASAGGIGGAGGGSKLTLVDSTVSGNTAAANGGGLELQGAASATLIHTTVTGNNAAAGGGGGVQLFGAGTTMELRNSVLAGNTNAASPDCSTTGPGLTLTGRNLLGSTAGCTFAANLSILNVNARLGPLADNGGPTRTHALLKGSPAIDQGSANACLSVDQRGAPQQGPCDIGAYERATCGGIVVNRIGTAGNDRIVGTKHSDGILGLAGKDVLKGLAGKDGLCGGGGKDTLKGGPGKDKLLGQGKKDRCIGGGGKDIAKKCEVRRSI